MCGIVGILQTRDRGDGDTALLQKMLGMIRHRGPDQFGIYRSRDDQVKVGLGSARLSIIDLHHGQQPIGNEDESLWIVFNGEAYNYVELRPILEAKGHRFRTDSDTEVVLHLFEEYGPDGLNQLNGQFAFAIWNERERSLFLARDRLGVRPLYYTGHNGLLLFASEIKALMAEPRVPIRFDITALDQIFTYWSPLSPRTAFAGIQTLPPGHWLLAKPGRDFQIQRYWQIEFPATGGPGRHREFGDWAAELRALLADATRLRLRSDVPVGAYLSGGLDSSAIAALVRQHDRNRLETFSIAFTDEAFDESLFQRQMAEHLGTTHHSVNCTHEDIGLAFPEAVWHTETPILRTSPVPLFLLSKLVQDHGFKVVLTGEGADEFLGGYDIFKEDKIRRFWARQPDSTIRPALLKKLYPDIGSLSGAGDAYLKKFFAYGLTELENLVYSHAIRWHDTSRCKRFISQDLQQAAMSGHDTAPLATLALPAAFSSWPPLARAQYLEIAIFLGEYLLSSQGDRVAMAHSVEGRFPFLDHRVVEFCNRLPPQLKLRGLDEKHVLKQAVRDLLPETIWHRSKRPYRAPIHRSFFPKGRPLDWAAEALSSSKVKEAGIFNPIAVSGLVQRMERYGTLGETDDMALAGILSTQVLYSQFVAERRTCLPIGEEDDIKFVIRKKD